MPDADLLAEWIRRTRASMLLLAAGGVMGALFVLGFGLLPIRTFVLVGPVVLLLFIGSVLVAVGRWVRRIPFTRRPIRHPPLQRIDRAAQVVGSGSVLLLVLGVVLLGGGAVDDRNAGLGVPAQWAPFAVAVAVAAPAVGAAWWGLRRISSVERSD